VIGKSILATFSERNYQGWKWF